MIRTCGKHLVFWSKNKISVHGGSRFVLIPKFRVSRSYAGTTNEENSSLTEKTVLNFNDTKRAYRSKTTGEVLRALLVFKLCSVNFLVDYNRQVCILSYQILNTFGSSLELLTFGFVQI